MGEVGGKRRRWVGDEIEWGVPQVAHRVAEYIPRNQVR
jgi:hypothetical protein